MSPSRSPGPATETLDVGERGRPRRPAPRARLLVVATPNDEAVGRSIALAPSTPLVLGRASSIDGVALDDGSASREHVSLTLRDDGLDLADLRSKNGTFVAAGRVRTTRLGAGELLQIGRSFLQFGYAEDLERFVGLGDFIGVGEAARRVAAAIVRAGGHRRAVLLEGPTGAGKEVVAREIHRQSQRSGPYVAINCATLERELASAELFGHVRGAFTGAQRSTDGVFGAADGGTLFLDEIGTLPLEIQPKLLRALQEGRVRRVGDNAESAVDVRVLAATNVALAVLADIGEFRLDLRARLAATRIELPALAARREDIPVLVGSLLRRQGLMGVAPTPRLLWALLAGRWLLNVRGLQNVVLTAADETEDGLLDLTPAVEVALRDQEQSAAARTSAGTGEPEPEAAAGSTRPDAAELRARLTAARGNVREVARSYDVHRNQLYRWLAHYGLDPKQFRDSSDDGK